MSFAQRERIIRGECDALRPEQLEQHSQCVGIVNERVHVKPRRNNAVAIIRARKVISWIRLVLRRNQIRPHVERVLDATDCEWERAAAVGEGYAKLWEPLKHAAEYHRANSERCLGRHADEPRQPVVRHSIFAEHVPRMNEDRRPKLLCRAPDGLERRIVQIQGVDATGVRIRIDVGADLYTAQPQLTNAALQFARREIGILQRDRPQARESLRVISDDSSDVIIQPARKIERVGWLRPIAEHHRHGRKHLHRNSRVVALLDATFGIPHIVGDLAKNALADHHPRAARLVVIQPNESAVAVFRVEVRPVAWEDVRMEVDLHENCRRLCQTPSNGNPRFTETPYSDFTGPGVSTFLPHFLHVRRASSFQKSSIAWLKCSTMSAQSKWISSTNAPQFSQ